MKFRYGAVSSVWELEADNKLTAYVLSLQQKRTSDSLIRA